MHRNSILAPAHALLSNRLALLQEVATGRRLPGRCQSLSSNGINEEGPCSGGLTKRRPDLHAGGGTAKELHGKDASAALQK